MLLFRLLICCALLSAVTARAADFYTVTTVTVTNAAGVPTNGTGTLTVNADVRTATNNTASNPSKLWLGTNSQLRAATNLYNHLAVYSFGSGATRLSLQWVTTNAFRLQGQINQAVASSVAGLWGTVASTNYTITNRTEMVSPAEAVSLTTRTNSGNAIAAYLNYATTFIAQTAVGLSNYVALATHQALSNKVFYASTNRGGALEFIERMSGSNVIVTNVVIHVVSITGGNFTGYVSLLTNGTLYGSTFIAGNYSGFVGSLTNGTLYSNALHWVTLTNPVTANLVNYGNAIRSEPPGYNSFQAGSNVTVSGNFVVAVGNNVNATNPFSTVVGFQGRTFGDQATVLGAYGSARAQGVTLGGATAGPGTLASGPSTTADDATNSIVLSPFGDATGEYHVALGYNFLIGGNRNVAFGKGIVASGNDTVLLGNDTADNGFTNGAALGRLATLTANNQIRLGTANHTVSTPGNLEVDGKTQVGSLTNAIHTGTNTFRGADLAFEQATISTVAAGHNVINVGTNVYVKLTGSPGAAWTLGGITGGNRNGKVLRLQNGTGFDVTVLNQSGTTPTASERIQTLAGAGGNTNVTVTGDAILDFIYDPDTSRWTYCGPVDVIASGTNGVNSISTNAAVVSAAATSLNISAAPGIALKGTNVGGAVSIELVDGSRLWSVTNDVTVTNTVAETSLITAGVFGSQTIPANFLRPGMTIQVKGWGKITTAAAPGVTTITVKLGSTLVSTNVSTPVGSSVNDWCSFDVTLTCRLTGASGSVKGQGLWQTPSTAGGAGVGGRQLKLGTFFDAATIDTTAAQTLDVTVTPGATTTGITICEAYALLIP
jgi:hypothetical protein